MELFFYKGIENILESKKEESGEQFELKKMQDSFLKVLDNKNLSFLLGSGCSSYETEIQVKELALRESIQEEIEVEQTEVDQPEVDQPEVDQSEVDQPEVEQPEVDQSEVEQSEEQQSDKSETKDSNIENQSKTEKVQIGIPIMAPIADEFYNSEGFNEEKTWLKEELEIDVTDSTFSTNLETFLSTLHSLSFYHSKKSKPETEESEKESSENDVNPKSFKNLTDFEKIDFIIKKARNFLLQKCLNEDNSKSGKDFELIELYKQFYRKLLSRNSTLPRLNIFTTNYDLYSERAMDLLGIHYVNGFTGGISKFFNPAIFNYALAEKMDLSQSKWSVIDNFFYLYKLHGSVNWIQATGDNKLFNVKEIQEPTFIKLKCEETIMIHPTPLKYNASLGSPYSDLFREFQKKLMQNNNILVTLGYSFSDEHINNLIFQAFTIPSFRLIVIGKPTVSNAIGKLQNLNDSRIWIIGGKDDSDIPFHYFKRFVDEIMPDLTAEDLDKKMETTINMLKDLLK